MENCSINSENSADKPIEQQDEYWDLFDDQMKFVKSIRKGECIPPNLYHITVEVIPTDMKGHLLLTERSLLKQRGPGKLEFPAGSVLSKEDPPHAALRELREETGLKPRQMYKMQRAVKRAQAPDPGLIRMTYMAVIPDLLTANIVLQPEEVSAYRIVTINQWLHEIAIGSFEAERTKLYGANLLKNIISMVGEPDESEINQHADNTGTPVLTKCDGFEIDRSQSQFSAEYESAEDIFFDPFMTEPDLFQETPM